MYVAGLERGAADRRLVDVHDLVDEVVALDPGVTAGNALGAVQLAGQVGVEDVVDQRRLAGAGDSGDGGEDAEREGDVDVAEVVLLGTDHRQLPRRVDRAADLRHRDGTLAGEVLAGDRLLVGEQLVQRTGVDDLAAVLTGARADVHDPVGDLDGVLVVLHHDQGVAHVAQADQGLDQPVVVALVEADRGLVQDVEHADQAGADLGGQPDALGLTAGEGARRAVEER